MLLRFIVENFKSFKDAVEFNTFPASKSHNHDSHKIHCGHTSALRMSSIYGANGAGKSNLIVAMKVLSNMVIYGSTHSSKASEDVRFKFDANCQSAPFGFAIEFAKESKIFYYHIEVLDENVVLEEMMLSKKNSDELIFRRDNNGIAINPEHSKAFISPEYLDALGSVIAPDMLLFSFLGGKQPDKMPLVASAFTWFVEELHIVSPSYSTGVVPHILDVDPIFNMMANTTIPEFNTGISSLRVETEVIDENDIKDNPKLSTMVAKAKRAPGRPIGDDGVNVIFDNGVVLKKTLVCIHKTVDNKEIGMALDKESDGTRRLIEYLPLFYAITHIPSVYVVDEIERSMHPIMIKDIMKKISESNHAVGQIIFSTHESCLLDLDIFRPDEVWFAQKDIEQATQLYPLSDYNIHHTANIENGYLNGRYGAIPFLSNLADLNW